MNVRAISAWKAASLTREHETNHTPAAFDQLRSAISRRQFARNAAGTAVMGATLGSLWRPGLAAAKTSFAPVPIPGGTPVLGGSYHLFGPAAIDPIDAEPSTITNFNGFVGLAYISGMVTQTNVKTGEKLRFPFVDSDMRFMKGEFRGTDRRMHHGAFAFIWVDVYLPGPGKQIHDLNPSAFPPVGLFWTIEISEDDSDEQEGDKQETDERRGGGVEVEFERGRAVMRVSKAPILDYGDIQNALFGGGPSPVPGSVSFKVVWGGANQRVNIRNTDPVFGGFEGEFIRDTAQMEWTARVGNYTFASDALATSSSSFAEIGHERNGSFFK